MVMVKKITSSKDYAYLLKHGKKIVCKSVVIVFYYNNSNQFSRLGVICSKKVGNAVARNKAKRRLKHISKAVFTNKFGYDVCFIARNGCNTVLYKSLYNQILKATNEKII